VNRSYVPVYVLQPLTVCGPLPFTTVTIRRVTVAVS